MRTGLIALDPTATETRHFHRFLAHVQFFQKAGFFSKLEIASIVSPDLYSYPHSFFDQIKGDLVNEAKKSLTEHCQSHLDYRSLHVLLSDSSGHEDHVSRLSRFAHDHDADILVTGSNDRSGLPYWMLGSFSETAALTATLPVLILKPLTSVHSLETSSVLLLTVDVFSPPTPQEIQTLASMSKDSGAEVHVLYVTPRPRVLLGTLQQKPEEDFAECELKKIKAALEKHGVTTTIKILDEGESVAHTISQYAEAHHVRLTAVTSPQRTKARRILLGSTARRILALTKQPFLSLRCK